MSIWDSIDRDEFEAHVRELERLAPYQDAQVNRVALNDGPDDVEDDACKLPESVESQIADDLAFLAAFDSIPACVSAATIVKSVESTGLTVRIAANEGIAPQVQDSLGRLLTSVERCARCEIPRDKSREQLLDIILDLHNDRIFERLGYPKYARIIKGLIKKAVPIAPRLAAMRQNAPARMSPFQRNTRASLLEDVDRLRHAIEEAKSVPSAKQTEVLRTVVKAAYEVTINGTSLPRRLIAAGYSYEYENRKEIRQTQALANYWRVCHYLVSATRRYHTLLTSCELNTIKANSPEIWPQGSKRKHFVHAEIQLLTYHETNTEIQRPSLIGVSKKACFLCNYFIAAYPGYGISKTHGEVLSQCTVLDKSEYSRTMRLQLANAMRATHTTVLDALETAKLPGTRLAPQAQSAINSVVDSVSAGSVLTIQANQPSDKLVKKESNDESYQGPQNFAIDDKRHVSTSAIGKGIVDLQSNPSNEVSHASDNGSAETIKGATSIKEYNFQAGSPISIRYSWLELLVELERPEDEKAQEQNTLKGSCKMLPGSSDEPSSLLHQVDAAKLSTVGSVTLGRPEGTTKLEVSFTAPGRVPIEARFAWSSDRARKQSVYL